MRSPDREMRSSIPDYSIIRIMSQTDARAPRRVGGGGREGGAECERGSETKIESKGTGYHYVCKSDSALNKILTDQSNTGGGGGGEGLGGRRTRVSLYETVALLLFFSPPVNTLPFFVTFCVGIASICTYANVCAHTRRSRAGSKDPRGAPGFSLSLAFSHTLTHTL